jgi:hypothetical protein
VIPVDPVDSQEKVEIARVVGELDESSTVHRLGAHGDAPVTVLGLDVREIEVAENLPALRRKVRPDLHDNIEQAVGAPLEHIRGPRVEPAQAVG